MTALQTVFHYYDNNRSPRRKANAFESKILTSLVIQVNTFFKIPRIVRLVAISLQPQVNKDIYVDVETVVVSPEEIAAAQSLLAVVPCIDLVEGLVQEVKVSDPLPDAPSLAKPVRIDIRAEVSWHNASFRKMLNNVYSGYTAYAVLLPIWVPAGFLPPLLADLRIPPPTSLPVNLTPKEKWDFGWKKSFIGGLTSPLKIQTPYLDTR
ncbi:hypothetical protein GGX14DRAFT_629734 [Mycena pura]|uniref:Uncharacterized protein n=1 Tax=Mycena pura TaxID=153505 RepID=A0AAD7E4U6_9AGAR|nr:hypothetical protein GGX14DRAFT_629734 [Mycena pura]